jgi:hypothetical protein
VEDDHFFLCLGVDATDGDWLPLYSRGGTNRIQIPATSKFGHPKWVSSASFYHPVQTWSVSHEGAVAAAVAAGDLSRPDDRNGVHEAGIPNI